MTKEARVYQNLNFMTPKAGVLVLGRDHISHIVKMIISIEFFFSTPRHGSDKLVYTARNDDQERSNKIVNFMTPRAGVLVLGHVHVSHIVKMHYFFKNLLLYSQT